MNYQLQGETIFMSRIEPKKDSKIILPDGSSAEPPITNKAIVTHVGEAVKNVKVGDQVVYKFGFEPMYLDGKIILVGNSKNILALIKE